MQNAALKLNTTLYSLEKLPHAVRFNLFYLGKAPKIILIERGSPSRKEVKSSAATNPPEEDFLVFRGDRVLEASSRAILKEDFKLMTFDNLTVFLPVDLTRFTSFP